MANPTDTLASLEHLTAAQLRRLLTDQLTRQKLGLYWEASAIERDAALNANIVLPRLVDDYSHGLADVAVAVDGLLQARVGGGRLFGRHQSVLWAITQVQ